MRNKFLFLLAVLFTTPALAAYQPPCGTAGEIQDNNSGYCGAYSASAAASYIGALTTSTSAGGDLSGTYPSPVFDLTKTHTWTAAQTVGTSSASGSGITIVNPGPLSGSSSTSNYLNVTATLPAVPTAGNQTAVSYQITTAGSAAFEQRAFTVNLAPGYTGSARNRAGHFVNGVAGTGVLGWQVGSANYALYNTTSGTTTGNNVGNYTNVLGSSSLNLGTYTTANNASAGNNVAVAGFALNGAFNIGGLFALQGSSAPTINQSAALIANNGAVAAPSFVALDNGSEAFRVNNGGKVGIGQASPAVSLDIGSKTDAVLLPVGTTAQRPTPSVGMIRYNSTVPQFEGYSAGAWSALGGGGSGSGTVNSGVAQQVAYYATTGSAVSGNANFVSTAAGAVGIRNTAPIADIEVSTSGAQDGSIMLNTQVIDADTTTSGLFVVQPLQNGIAVNAWGIEGYVPLADGTMDPGIVPHGDLHFNRFSAGDVFFNEGGGGAYFGNSLQFFNASTAFPMTMGAVLNGIIGGADFIINAQNGGTGSGGNNNGGSIYLNGGNSTGTGSSKVKISVAPYGSTGTAVRTSTLKFTFGGDGSLELGTGTTNKWGNSRLALTGGTAIATSDWALSGWGAHAPVSAVSGNDSRGTVTVTTSALDTPSANPTITLTFKDGTWSAAPYAVSGMNDGSTGSVAATGCSTTATTLRITYAGTPLAVTAKTYIFNYQVII